MHLSFLAQIVSIIFGSTSRLTQLSPAWSTCGFLLQPAWITSSEWDFFFFFFSVGVDSDVSLNSWTPGPSHAVEMPSFIDGCSLKMLYWHKTDDGAHLSFFRQEEVLSFPEKTTLFPLSNQWTVCRNIRRKKAETQLIFQICWIHQWLSRATFHRFSDSTNTCVRRRCSNDGGHAEMWSLKILIFSFVFICLKDDFWLVLFTIWVISATAN